MFITAVVTAVISALVGGLWDSYWNRAKPSVALLSVGFTAPLRDASIKLPDDLVEMAKRLPWQLQLERFSPFAHVLEMERSSRSQLQEARETISNLEDWKPKYLSQSLSSYKVDDKLPRNAILNYPYIASDVAANTIFILLQRGAALKTTFSLDEARAAGSPLIKTFDDTTERRWKLYTSYKITMVPYVNTSDSSEKEIDLFTESLSRGISQNMAEFTDYFIGENSQICLR